MLLNQVLNLIYLDIISSIRVIKGRIAVEFSC